jgi:hypothetical protein
MDQGWKYQPGGGGIQGEEEGCGSRAGGRRTWMPGGPVWGGQVERGVAIVVDESVRTERRIGMNIMEKR